MKKMCRLHFTFCILCVCLCFGVCNTKVENIFHGMGGVRVEVGKRYDFCMDLWILTSLRI